MNINYFFLIDKKTNNPEKIIFLAVRYKNSRFLLHTKERIADKYWDDKKRKVKSNYTGHSELNYFLESFKEHVKSNVRQIRTLNPTIHFSELREKVKDIYKDKPQNNFFDIWEEYITIKKPTVSDSFISNYNNLKNTIQQFAKDKGKNIDFDAMTLSFFDQFQNFMINDLKLQNNTIKHKIRFLKMFLKWCNDRGIIENRQYEKFKPVSGNDSNKFALTSVEIKALINVELDENLSKSRDVFLFQFYTGQRISDIMKFDYQDGSDTVWNLTQQKTKVRPQVPLYKNAQEIIKKYNGILPDVKAKTLNRHLKIIAESAGLDGIVTFNEYRGSEVITTRFKKYEKLSTHIARHTFETVMTHAKINQQTIDAITGHKSQTMSSKYYHPDNKELLKIITEAFDKFLGNG